MNTDWTPLVDDYLSSLAAAGNTEATLTLRRGQLEQLSRAVNCPPNEVTEQVLLDWFGRQSWRKETRRSMRSAVQGFCAWAYRHGHLEHDPAESLPVVPCEVGPPRPAPDDVYHTALEHADDRTALMLRLAGEVGLRRGEICRIHTDDVLDGVDGPQLLVHGKGEKLRVIPIPTDIARVLRRGDGWMFPNGRGGHVGPRRVGELCSAVLGGWTVHTLRHRFASRAYRGSHDIRAVQLLLGHQSVATTQLYIAAGDDDLRAAMNAAA